MYRIPLVNARSGCVHKLNEINVMRINVSLSSWVAWSKRRLRRIGSLNVRLNNAGWTLAKKVDINNNESEYGIINSNKLQ